MRKRILCTFMLFVMCISMLSGCAKEEISSNNEKINIVCSIYPIYDWINEIIGEENEKYNVTLLIDSGVDYHSYQPSADEIINISNADLFLYVGGESDLWVNQTIKNSVNGEIIKLIDVLGDAVKEEEIISGMEEDNQEEEGEEAYDEHVWLSLKNAKVICEKIKDEISLLDSENKDVYESNYQEYELKLSELDLRYEEVISNAANNTILVGDRFPFRYLVDDYGIEYYAAFSGCSSETNASFDTVVFLAEKVNELALNNIFVTESSNNSIAETIIDNTTSKNQNILVMNSMQSINLSDIESGVSYLSIMEDNLESLEKGLN